MCDLHILAAWSSCGVAQASVAFHSCITLDADITLQEHAWAVIVERCSEDASMKAARAVGLTSRFSSTAQWAKNRQYGARRS